MWSWLVRLWKKLTAPPAPPRPKVRPPIEPLEGRRMLSVVSHAAPSGAGAVPRYDHVVVVVEENHSYSQILGPEVWPPMAFNPIVWSAINQPLPITLDLYTRNLARQSAVMADSHGIAHPSQPNYLALFSGSTQGVNSDGTPKQTFSGPDLAVLRTIEEMYGLTPTGNAASAAPIASIFG